MMNCLLAALAIAGTQKLTSSVEVPFRTVADAIVVDATVNGKRVSVVYDTGFAGSFALSDRVDLGKPTGEASIQDFVGVSTVASFTLKSVQLGTFKPEILDAEIISQPGFDGSWSYGTHIDGIMGLSVTMPYVCEINLQKSKFVFHPDSHDVTQLKPDNKRTFLVRILPLGKRHIQVASKTADGQTLVMALDTGNSGYATTHPDSLARVSLWEEGRQPKWTYLSYIASGPVETFSVAMKGAKIFGIPVAESVWNVINLPSSGADSDGTIGFQFLKNFNMTIDMKRRVVWMENFTGTVAGDEAANVGLTAFPDAKNKQMTVVRVLAGSPAEKAGVKRGDRLIAVDDRVLGAVGMRRVEAMLSGAAGSKVKVQVSRSGSLKTFVMERVLLVNPVGK